MVRDSVPPRRRAGRYAIWMSICALNRAATLIWMIGQHLTAPVYPATVPIAEMTATQIFRGYVRFVGESQLSSA